MKGIGNRIRLRRKELKMSQDELADAIGANRVTISCYENEKYAPSTQAVIDMANALGVSTNYLMGNYSEHVSPEESIRFALFGDPAPDITDEDFEDIRRYAQFLRERRKK